jgi:hypothetical protein
MVDEFSNDAMHAMHIYGSDGGEASIEYGVALPS